MLQWQPLTVIPDSNNHSKSIIHFTPSAAGSATITASTFLVDTQQEQLLMQSRDYILNQIKEKQQELSAPGLSNQDKQNLESEISGLQSQAIDFSNQIAALPQPLGSPVSQIVYAQ